MNFKKVRLFGTLAIITGSATVFGWAMGGSVLQINGKPVSNRVKVMDGESWVPVRDLAKSQGLVVTSSGGVLNLVTAGGANQVGTLQGKIGDTLFDGHWKFSISKFEPVDTYTIVTAAQTDYGVTSPVSEIENGVITPKKGTKLYVATCTLKNGMTHGAQFEWTSSDTKNAVADTNGVNHPWLVFDIASSAFVTKEMLPGAAINFKICFAVADGATPQDVVITLLTLGEKTGTDIRFHVSGANQ